MNIAVLPLLLLIVAIVVGAIVVIASASANSRRALAVIAGVIAACLLLFFAMTFLYVAERRVSQSRALQNEATAIEYARYKIAPHEFSDDWDDAPISTENGPPLSWSDPRETLIGGGSAWLAVVEDVHDPVVFPSAGDAAAALGRKAALLFKGAVSESENPPPVRVYVAPMQYPEKDEIVSSLMQSLAEQIESAQVMVVEGEDAVEGDAVSIHVSMTITDKRTALWSLHRSKSGSLRRASFGPERKEQPRYEQLSGKLRAEVHWPENNKQLSISFVDKPWVKQYSEFVSIRGGRHWLLARSGDLTSNQIEAKQQAIRAAAQWMAPSIRAQAIQMSGGPRRGFQVQSEQAIAEDLRVAMSNHGQYIVDEFAQELRTSEGYVWRDALLLDFSPSDFDNRAILAVNVGKRVQVRNMSAMASIVGLIVLIATVYVFLNAATKGYYTWSLRGVALVVLVIGGAVLLIAVT